MMVDAPSLTDGGYYSDYDDYLEDHPEESEEEIERDRANEFI